MPEKDEPFANPAAPPGAAQRVNVEATPARLTNADFRKLLMTPRAGQSGASAATPSATPASTRPEVSGKIDKAEERRKKKSYYAKLKRAEDDIMAELAKKYRDRAKERRDGDETPAPGAQPDLPSQPDESNSTASAYRAVAPDLKSGLDAAERRRQQIQESKFLGGDMEHTHLVKGLDYALLQKVRSEIQAMELEHEDELEQLADGADVSAKEHTKEEEIHFKTKLGKNVYRVLFGDKPPLRNELFLPGRTAYRIDLEDEMVDFDIPTTVVRSKADCPLVETATTLTTNDIVINKLTQILSYLRQGRHGRRIKKKDKQRADEKKAAGEDIYAELGDYVPAPAGRDHHRASDSRRGDGDRQRKPRSYFDRPEEEDRRERGERYGRERREKERDEQQQRDKEQAERDQRDRQRFEQEKGRESNWLAVDAAAAAKRNKDMGTALSGYAECYPGLDEMADAIDDSDDEADYSKMDMGNKKGPIGRWDFDTQEEYSNYMNQKEALPKAAFQYGVKMADGRKTRRLPKERNEKAELDREWQKISAIIAKRKSGGDDGGEKSKRAKQQ
ncbi:protein Red-like [Amphibalanus amphitrite]|uniref:protein Red-like n=1 Tax=Amphibalanus amphitrite TaxID=1232801 RepID=UPI001C9269A7|nr:protein Red-like [Amphibalanus amphitrite]XP_043215803.1 protein Red-like [Amphibalanus amphitrite]XP_043215812.1 protein Red-like [Amphibalanus amphitrite]XP_043215819.1 protein Red-like [Amphibalanus amphitrite]XP_043215826.1 protein Red-like [Amphibalanus amphitrite]XP_043215834.1 protein Red-like [Amphibalanus amphitrite]XP_043215841.1 protein Red-like [Amphibalanus amphitrite]